MENGNVTPLLFEGESLVRIVMMDDEPWFIGRDVCRVLGIKNESDALARLDVDERRDGFRVGTETGERVGTDDPLVGESVSNGDPSVPKTGRGYATVVSEPGVFRLIFTSRRPEAERFKRWLAHDVLPQLRRTGSYTIPGASDAPPNAEQRPFPEWPLEEMRTKKGVADMYRLLYGPMAAQWIAPQLGFPSPPIELIQHGRQFTMTLSFGAEEQEAA